MYHNCGERRVSQRGNASVCYKNKLKDVLQRAVIESQQNRLVIVEKFVAHDECRDIREKYKHECCNKDEPQRKPLILVDVLRNFPALIFISIFSEFEKISSLLNFTK